MKNSLIVLLCLFVTACASSNKDVFMGTSHLPVQKEQVLKNYTTDDVQRVYGKPVAVRTEEPNTLWTYRQNNCTRLIYFNHKGRVCHSEARGECREESQALLTQK